MHKHNQTPAGLWTLEIFTVVVTQINRMEWKENLSGNSQQFRTCPSIGTSLTGCLWGCRAATSTRSWAQDSHLLCTGFCVCFSAPPSQPYQNLFPFHRSWVSLKKKTKNKTMQTSKFASIKGFETFCWEKCWSSEAPDVGNSQQFWKYSFTERKVLVVVFHKTHCNASTFILTPFKCCWGPAALLEISCHGTSLGQGCRIRLRNSSSGLWEKTPFPPEIFPFLCEGRRKWGRSGVGKTLGKKCQGFSPSTVNAIKNVTALLTSGGAARSHLQTANLSRANFLWHFQGRKEMLCPVSLQLPGEGRKRRNNGKKAPKWSELLVTSARVGWSLGWEHRLFPCADSSAHPWPYLFVCFS